MDRHAIKNNTCDLTVKKPPEKCKKKDKAIYQPGCGMKLLPRSVNVKQKENQKTEQRKQIVRTPVVPSTEVKNLPGTRAINQVVFDDIDTTITDIKLLKDELVNITIKEKINENKLRCGNPQRKEQISPAENNQTNFTSVPKHYSSCNELNNNNLWLPKTQNNIWDNENSVLNAPIPKQYYSSPNELQVKPKPNEKLVPHYYCENVKPPKKVSFSPVVDVVQEKGPENTIPTILIKKPLSEPKESKFLQMFNTKTAPDNYTKVTGKENPIVLPTSTRWISNEAELLTVLNAMFMLKQNYAVGLRKLQLLLQHIHGFPQELKDILLDPNGIQNDFQPLLSFLSTNMH